MARTDYRVTHSGSNRFEELSLAFRRMLRETAVQMADTPGGDGHVTANLLRRAAIETCGNLITEWSAVTEVASHPYGETNVA